MPSLILLQLLTAVSSYCGQFADTKGLYEQCVREKLICTSVELEKGPVEPESFGTALMTCVEKDLAK